jgi:RNA polymerase sigma-70 factor (ECF subfamily)
LWEAEEVAAHAPTLDAIDQQGLAEALAELPDEFRVVVLMFYFEDLSYKEIAEQLELPIGTVMSRLSRAKGHLRRRLADDWAEDPAVAPSTVSPSKLSRRDSSTRSTNGAHPSSPSRTSNPT